ncbi:hypothetical protein [Streptomyces sp. TLI_185]|uniref:hypothetical protein n=1 Tax=Streptomyces sp. TLI_185 TaxID=2485151 RepID=UPI000F4FBC67|nr:hypothetical protein [Streptomyces sp. TLI_185]RPF24814.1 hypothetical protein EDD92_9758 [Streptomyces sp. TLI_185]
MTHTLGSSHARRPGPTMPSSGPAGHHAPRSAEFIPRPPDSDRLTHAADLTPQPAAGGHELTLAAETDGDEARGLAASLPPRAGLVLLSAVAETDASPPEPAVAPLRSGLSILPTYQEPGPDLPTGDPESGAPEFWQAPPNDPPDALIRLRFADAIALERAGAAFGTGSGPDLGDAWSDLATLTLQISGDAGVETLRAVLAVLDAAAVTAESLTVHTHELDDVYAAFTSLP